MESFWFAVHAVEGESTELVHKIRRKPSVHFPSLSDTGSFWVLIGKVFPWPDQFIV